MSKYLFCIIVGIILFVLWNNYDGFSVGIPWKLDLAPQTGGATGQPQNIFEDLIDAYMAQEDNPDAYTGEPHEIETDGTEIAEPPCPAPISESEAAGVCSENKAKCAVGSMSGPNLGCTRPPPQPVRPFGTGTGTGGGSQQSPTCNRFLMTKAISCLKESPEIMKSLFDEYKELSTRLSLPGDEVDIANIPGFESLTETQLKKMEMGDYGSVFSIIFDDLRENGCQLRNLDIVLRILSGNINFKFFFLMGRRGELITNSVEITRRSKMVINILLFLIMCGFNIDIIILLFPIMLSGFKNISKFINTYYNRNGILVYSILYSLFAGLLHQHRTHIDIHRTIRNWLNTQNDRFNDYKQDGSILWDLHTILTYNDFMSLFQYFKDNCPPSLLRGSREPPDIISALSNQIFKDFFGLP